MTPEAWAALTALALALCILARIRRREWWPDYVAMSVAAFAMYG